MSRHSFPFTIYLSAKKCHFFARVEKLRYIDCFKTEFLLNEQVVAGPSKQWRSLVEVLYISPSRYSTTVDTFINSKNRLTKVESLISTTVQLLSPYSGYRLLLINMGSGASSTTSTVLSAESLPDQLFVEGAGSAKANGKFVLRTDKDGFPTKRVVGCNQSVWFAKDDDDHTTVGFVFYYYWVGYNNNVVVRGQGHLF